MALRHLTSSFSRGILQFNVLKTASTFRGLKQISRTETPDGKVVIEGVYVPSPREKQLIQLEETQNCNACYMCRLNLDVKHTDVLILSQFVRSDGRMHPRRITGLCKRQQKQIGALVTMAHKAGLIPTTNYKGVKKDPNRRFQWKACNSYWDETTLKF